MNIQRAGLRALTTSQERKELRAVGVLPIRATLKRTFNQKTYDNNLRVTGAIKFWRVIGPLNHPNINSDLSIDGLKEWRII